MRVRCDFASKFFRQNDKDYYLLFFNFSIGVVLGNRLAARTSTTTAQSTHNKMLLDVTAALWIKFTTSPYTSSFTSINHIKCLRNSGTSYLVAL